MAITVGIAEDNDLLAVSIKEKLELFSNDIRCKYRARNGKELLSKLSEDNKVDTILMDIEMPVMDGITATEEVKKKYPWIKIIMLTVFDDDDKIFRAIQAGAMGYLLKDEPPKKIVESIRLIMEGGAPMSATIAAKTLRLLRNPEIVKSSSGDFDVELSKREIEILEHLKQGFDYKKIADALYISPSTVRKHIENIYQKLQVHNKIEAVQKALRHKIID
jgi:DNA-binding NarL/FixJ family response regulator